MKKMMAIILVMSMLVGIVSLDRKVLAQTGVTFADVKATTWYTNDLNYILNDSRKIFVGYPDGTFKPDNTLTIEQFVKTLIVACQFTSLTPSKVYWALPYTNKALEIGILKASDFNDYKRAITREEMALLVVRTSEYIGNEPVQRDLIQIESLIKDKDKLSKDKKQAVLRAYDLGILVGAPGGYYNPQSILSRAEAVAVLRRIIDPTSRIIPDLPKEETVPVLPEDGTIPVITDTTGGYVDNSKYYNYTRNTFPIGGGVDGPTDYSRSNIFVDLINTTEGLGTPDSPWTLGTIKADANGWPLEDFGIMLFRDQFNIDNSGTYKMSFECAGIPNVRTIASSGTITNLVRNSQTGIVTGDITIQKQYQLFLSFTNTQGGVKNLKVIRPGYTEKQTFTKEFLDHMDRFAVIRTMDLTLTNNNTQVTWADRKLPNSGPPQHGKTIGVPWEYCVELANTVKSDLWINIPHMADANYIKNLATLIKNQLNPELNLYFEYSNENWNWMFEQANWTLAQANKEPYLSKLNYDGQQNQYYLHWRMIGEKLKECSDIFGQVWGQSAINTRVRPVLSAQIVYDVTYAQPLKYLKDNYGDPSNYIYAVAGAPYFNLGEDIQREEGITVDQILAGFETSIDEMLPFLELLRGFAKEYNLKMLAYEGGSDTFGPGSLVAKEASQKDPRFKAIVMRYLENWYYAGGDVFCWYVAGATNWQTQYGTWGLINTPGEETGPKIAAVDAVIAAGFSKYASGQIPTDNPLMNLTIPPQKIDFNQLADTGVNNNLGEKLVVGDFTFQGTRGLIAVQSLGWTTSYPSIVLHGNAWGSVMRIVKTDNNPFSIKSIKFFRPYNMDQSSEVRITGYMHTRGSYSITLEIPLESGRNGFEYTFPNEWVKIGLKEIKIEFLAGSIDRFGGIDDVVIYDHVAP